MSKYTRLAERMEQLEKYVARQELQLTDSSTQNRLLMDYLGVFIAKRHVFGSYSLPGDPTITTLKESDKSKLRAIMEFLEAEFHTEPACNEKLTVRVKKNGK